MPDFRSVRGSIDLNADLGEGYPTDEALLELVTSASVACGVHAGDPSLILATARSARARGVVLGAHPSYPDREGFGRRDANLPRDDLVATVAYQIGALREVAALAGSAVRFVKPHGALYNRASVDAGIAAAVVEAVRRFSDDKTGVLCPPRSSLAETAARLGVPVFLEAFADRAYRPDGTLLPRSEPGALLTDPNQAAEQARRIALDATVVATDGSVLSLEADSICVHGDTPGALEVAAAVRNTLEDAGVTVEPFIRG